MAKQAQANALFSFSLIEDNAAIDKHIKSIGTRGNNLQKDMHIAACSILNKLINSGDVPLAERQLSALFKAMPGMSRVNSLKSWFEAYGPISFEKGKAVYVKKPNIADSFAEACKVPFWKLVAMEGVAYKPLKLEDEITKLVKRLEADAEKTGADHSKAVDGLKALIAA